MGKNVRHPYITNPSSADVSIMSTIRDTCQQVCQPDIPNLEYSHLNDGLLHFKFNHDETYLNNQHKIWDITKIIPPNTKNTMIGAEFHSNWLPPREVPNKRRTTPTWNIRIFNQHHSYQLRKRFLSNRWISKMLVLAICSW